MQKIRLTESQLHKVIKESVHKILEDYDNLEAQYAHDTIDKYGAWGGWPADPKSHSKEDENEYSWDLSDDVDNLRQDKLKDYEDADNFFDQFAPDPDEARNNWVHGKHVSDYKKKLDKEWQDTLDKEKYTQQADSRPLHRKGSLNRAFDED